MSLQHTKSRSVNSFDYDNDGDLDLIFSIFDNDLNMWENTSVDNQYTDEIMGAWVKFNLEGSTSNKDGLGTILEVEFEDGTKQIRHYNGSGYQHQSIQSTHFGGGENNMITTLKVKWPSSGEEIYSNIEMNSTYEIIEGLSLIHI